MTLLRRFLALMIPCIVLLSANSHAQQTKLIRFKNTAEAYEPVHFRVGKIVDVRDDTSNIGIMRAGLANRPTPVNFTGGLAAAMAEYINRNVNQKADQPPIDIHIKALKITETSTGMKERATLDYAFLYIKGEQPLFTFTGTAYIETGMDASAYLERLVRQGIGSTLRQMDDNWMQASALMATPSIAVKVILDTTASGSKIAYTRSRPLTMADFIGTPDDLSRGVAATYSGIDIRYQTQSLGPQITLTVHIAPFADKSKSWCRPKSRNNQVLAHEQRHFDITAVHACILKRNIEAYTFSPEQASNGDVESIMRDMQTKVQQQSDTMQTAYDAETAHGLNAKAQEQWNTKIAALLATGACY